MPWSETTPMDQKTQFALPSSRGAPAFVTPGTTTPLHHLPSMSFVHRPHAEADATRRL